jgi:hypothetical protein
MKEMKQVAVRDDVITRERARQGKSPAVTALGSRVGVE